MHSSGKNPHWTCSTLPKISGFTRWMQQWYTLGNTQEERKTTQGTDIRKEHPRKAIFTIKQAFFLSKFVATSKLSLVINQPATLKADSILQTHFWFTNNDLELSQPSNPVFLCILWHHPHNLPVSTPCVHTTLGLCNRFSMCTKTRHGP